MHVDVGLFPELPRTQLTGLFPTSGPSSSCKVAHYTSCVGSTGMDIGKTIGLLTAGESVLSFLGGYNGSFSFKEIGMEIPDEVPYVFMRLICGLCGLLTVPLAYLTLRASGHSMLAAFLSAAFVMLGGIEIAKFSFFTFTF